MARHRQRGERGAHGGVWVAKDAAQLGAHSGAPLPASHSDPESERGGSRRAWPDAGGRRPGGRSCGTGTGSHEVHGGRWRHGGGGVGKRGHGAGCGGTGRNWTGAFPADGVRGRRTGVAGGGGGLGGKGGGGAIQGAVRWVGHGRRNAWDGIGMAGGGGLERPRIQEWVFQGRGLREGREDWGGRERPRIQEWVFQGRAHREGCRDGTRRGRESTRAARRGETQR